MRAISLKVWDEQKIHECNAGKVVYFRCWYEQFEGTSWKELEDEDGPYITGRTRLDQTTGDEPDWIMINGNESFVMRCLVCSTRCQRELNFKLDYFVEFLTVIMHRVKIVTSNCAISDRVVTSYRADVLKQLSVVNSRPKPTWHFSDNHCRSNSINYI